MRMRRVQRAAAVAVAIATVVGGTALASAATGQPARVHSAPPSGIQHVLLISVDGLHQQDLTWYVNNFPNSTLATLDHQGLEYSDAMTPFPSDSFPGMVGQVTGGNPGTTGIYYDDTWNHAVFPAGTTSCSGPVPGAEVAYTEADDVDQTRLDAGQGLRNLPGSILRMTPNPLRVINPANLPVDPATCQPIYPNQYLQVNTIFNVAHDAGMLPPGPTSTRPTWRCPARRATASRTTSPRRSTATRSATPPARTGPATTTRPCSTTPIRCRRC